MFKYILPDGLQTSGYYDIQGKLRFDPPVYEQRYNVAIRILEDHTWCQAFKKILEIGCAEMKFFQLLRRIETVEHILQVDIDEYKLEDSKKRVQPLLSDYISYRQTPLRVEVLAGDATSPAENLLNTDAVVALELIEHMEADVLEKLPQNIFGFVQPKLAIFSTPNSEVNVLFSQLLPNGFRHPDHKFEWNRNEFKSWALDICSKFPNYCVSFLGAGILPSKDEHLGCVTQFAIFARNDLRGLPLRQPLKTTEQLITDEKVRFKEICSVDFPYKPDTRTKEEKIMDEVTHYISRNCNNEDYFNTEKLMYELPLKNLRMAFQSQGMDVTDDELLEHLIKNKIKFSNDHINVSIFDTDSEEEDYNYEEQKDHKQNDDNELSDNEENWDNRRYHFGKCDDLEDLSEDFSEDFSDDTSVCDSFEI